MKTKKWIQKSSLQLLLVLFTCIGIVACSKNDDGGGGSKPSSIASSLGTISGDNQTAIAETTLTNEIVVLVKDQNGVAFSGAKVNFKVIEGAVSSNTITTGKDGKATISWTLGTTIDTQTLTITVFKADGTTALTGSPLLVTAIATAAPLVATSLELISSAENEELRIITDNVTINMVVKDQNGDPVDEIPLNFSVAEGAVVDTENSDTPVTWTLGSTVGTQTLTVTAFKEDGTTHLLGSPFSVIVNTEALVASSLILVSANNIEGIVNEADTKTIAIKVLNNLGQNFAGTAVGFSIEENGGTLSTATALTDANGIATVDWAPGDLIGDKKITVSAFKPNGTALNNSPIVVIAKAIVVMGTFYKGGIVSYLDNTGKHGFVCSLKDVGQAEWGCKGTKLTGAVTMKRDIGEGDVNSFIIIINCATPGIAAKLCTDANLQGFTNWYLPSYNELRQIDNRFDFINEQLQKHGGESLTNEIYWSSNEDERDIFAGDRALKIELGPKLTDPFSKEKDEIHNVRAIQYF